MPTRDPISQIVYLPYYSQMRVPAVIYNGYFPYTFVILDNFSNDLIQTIQSVPLQGLDMGLSS